MVEDLFSVPLGGKCLGRPPSQASLHQALKEQMWVGVFIRLLVAGVLDSPELSLVLGKNGVTGLFRGRTGMISQTEHFQ